MEIVMVQKIIFTDLDGSLLDEKTYSFDRAKPALRLINESHIPLILCSSKTRREIELYRQRLNNTDPFVSENGGGIFIPEGYFALETSGESVDHYRVVSHGTAYAVLRKAFVALREKLGTAVRGFGDMSVAEVSVLTGLPLEEAALAKMREFDEPFVFHGDPDEEFLGAIKRAGFCWTTGRLHHIMGRNDKGQAVNILIKLYEKKYGRLVTMGLGDSLNDLPMLQAVDQPALIRREDGSFDGLVNIPGLVKTSGRGSAGWGEAVSRFLKS
ncbi:MAG: HAD-IIB family hydrolase [Smithellaceae bacterium]|nr:HAD-IIB family hydrolase [Smithellaceae bacterium]